MKVICDRIRGSLSALSLPIRLKDRSPIRLLILLLILSLQLGLFLLLHSHPAAAGCRSWLWRSCSHFPPASPGVSLSLPSNISLALVADGNQSFYSCESGRIYVYDLPPRFNEDLLASCSSLVPWVDLCPALSNNGIGSALDLPSWLGTGFWYSTSQFSSEVLYHARMLLHPCRTLDPERATAFFIPFYAGLDLGRYLFVDSSLRQRDQLSRELLDWLKRQEYWKRNGGRDHFLVIGRITWDFRRSESSTGWSSMWGFRRSGWGSNFFLMPELKNPLRLTIERSPWDAQEIAIPYPTSFHPRTDNDVVTWQRLVASMKRSLLFSYAGAARPQFANDFRGLLLDQCRQSTSCRSFDCSKQRCEHPLPVMELFLDSTFCLQPRGDSFTRRSIFDSLIAGCIPVFFWHRSAYLQYEWHLPADGSSYSVFISRKDVRSGFRIEDILRGLSEKRIKRMQETLIKAIPRFVYSVPGNHTESFRDAFDIAVDVVLNVTKQRVVRSG